MSREIPEFQMWVGWSPGMDMQVGIGLPQDEMPEGSQTPVSLMSIMFSDPLTLQLIGEWMATFARSASDEDTGTMIQNAEGTTGYWQMEPDVMRRNALALVHFLGGLNRPHGDSIWWTPDRYGVNHLIRLLRKARDAAFGRDE